MTDRMPCPSVACRGRAGRVRARCRHQPGAHVPSPPCTPCFSMEMAQFRGGPGRPLLPRMLSTFPFGTPLCVLTYLLPPCARRAAPPDSCFSGTCLGMREGFHRRVVEGGSAPYSQVAQCPENKNDPLLFHRSPCFSSVLFTFWAGLHDSKTS